MEQKIYLYNLNPIYTNSYTILVDFYMPLISNQAISLYYYLESKVKDNIKVLYLDNIINETKYDSSKILMIRKLLEGIDLIKTYKDENSGDLHIILNGVKSPKDIFSSIKFSTLLESIKSEEELKALKEKYNLNIDLDKKYKDISSSFSDCFNLSLKDNKTKVENNFQIETKNAFKDNVVKYIKRNSNIDVNSVVNDEIIQKLYEISSLFGLNEDEISYYAIRFYVDESFDFEKMINAIKKEISFHKVFKKENKNKIKINSDTEFAKLINKYESTAPRLFLKEKQNGIEVVSSELNLLLTLKDNLHLSNGVINCLIDYVLTIKDGELNTTYVTKVAASLVRKNINNSLDAYNFLYKNKKYSKKNDENETKIEEKKDNNDTILLDLEGDDEESLF